MSKNLNKEKDSITETIREIGFAKTSFFTEVELNKLKPALKSILPEPDTLNKSYHVTLLSSDLKYKENLHQILNPIIQQKAETILSGYTVLLTNLIIKQPGGGEVPLHQNWTFVDEDKFRSITIWIPLDDTNEINGTLEFIPGTHNIFADVKRGHNTPYFFLNKEVELKKFLIPVSLRAGEALIFDDAILHYSKKNLSDKSRIAIQVTLIPEQAPLFHYHFKEGLIYDKLVKLSVNKSFYNELNFETDKNSLFEKYIKRKINKKEWQEIAFFYKLQVKMPLSPYYRSHEE